MSLLNLNAKYYTNTPVYKNSLANLGSLNSYGYSDCNNLFNLYNTLYANKATATNTNYTIKNNRIRNYSSKSPIRLSGNMGKDIVSTAKQYIGYNENDNSYKLFTQGRNEAWCADFVTYTVKEAYKSNGKSAPSGFGSSSVEGLRQWGQANNCYLDTTAYTNKSDTIASNVKPGDVVIFKNGISHTGVVSKVNKDGSFQTIEGNTSNQVAYRNYSAHDSKISGFVQLA